MNYVDVLVTVASLVEVAFVALVLPMNPTLFRLLRIGKLARALRMVTMTSVLSSLQLLIKCLSASLDMLPLASTLDSQSGSQWLELFKALDMALCIFACIHIYIDRYVYIYICRDNRMYVFFSSLVMP